MKLFSIVAAVIVLSAAPVDARPRGSTVAGSFNGGKSQVQFAGTEGNFLNIMKTAQNWSHVTGGAQPSPDPVTGFNFDSNIYPRNIPVGTGGVQALMQIPTDAERSWSDVVPGVTGAYTHKWDGCGTIVITGFTLVSGSLTSGAGSVGNTITLRPTINRPSIGVSAVCSSTDYPRNFYLYYTADQADVTAGKLLSAKARERLTAMRVGALRYLAWLGGDGNQSMIARWQDRKTVNAVSYGMTEPRTSLYAGQTTEPGVKDHYVITFNDPVYGPAPAVDKQMVLLQWNSSQVGNRSYLTFNGREDLICTPRAAPADPAGGALHTGVPGANLYTVLSYDALLQCWLNFGADNANAYIDNGVPAEVQLAAAIEIGAQPHFVTPTYASDAGTSTGQLTDYMSGLIDMVRAAAPAWMNPAYETPNEWWNTAAAFYLYPWSSVRQQIRNGGAVPGATAAAPFQVTSITYTSPLTVTGAGAGSGGKVRLTVASTASLTTGQIRTVSSVGGTVEANGVWKVTVIDATNVDLDGSTFVNAWTSGGTISGRTVMQASGSLPPLGASLIGLNNQPTVLNGFNTATGSVVAVGASSFDFDATPTAGTWSGNSSAATLTLAGSTVSVTYTTADRNAIVLSTTGSLPAPLVAGTVYYVRTGGAGGTPFQIAATPGGAAIDFSAGSQSGTHTGVQVIALNPAPNDIMNGFGTVASNLGKLLQTKYSVADPKNQTKYRMVVGVKGGSATYASGTVGSDPRVTSKYLVVNTGAPTDMAKFYATHVSPANYFAPSAYGSGAQETALANRWNGTLFTAGIVNGVMTVASFQNSGTTNMANGQVVFGYGMPALGSAGQVTIVSGPGSGVGVYTLSDNTINVATGTSLYSGADYTAVQEWIDSANAAEITATISNGSGGSGNQMVVTAISPVGPGKNSTIYLNGYLRGSPITAETTISNLGTGGGGIGTYTISRNLLVTTPTTFLAGGSFDLQQINTNLSNWKTWAQGFGINNMVNYEGGYSPDYSGGGTSKTDLLKYAGKLVPSSTGWATGTKQMLLQNYANVDALTGGGFTATFPSSFNLEGRYPSGNVWSVYENYFFTAPLPQVQAITTYNN